MGVFQRQGLFNAAPRILITIEEYGEWHICDVVMVSYKRWGGGCCGQVQIIPRYPILAHPGDEDGEKLPEASTNPAPPPFFSLLLPALLPPHGRAAGHRCHSGLRAAEWAREHGFASLPLTPTYVHTNKVSLIFRCHFYLDGRMKVLLSLGHFIWVHSYQEGWGFPVSFALGKCSFFRRFKHALVCGTSVST